MSDASPKFTKIERVPNIRELLTVAQVGDKWAMTNGREVTLTGFHSIGISGTFEVLGREITSRWLFSGTALGMYHNLACPADYLVRRDGTRLETPSAPEKARIAQNLIDAGYLTPDQAVGLLEYPISAPAPAVMCVGPHAPVDTGMRRSWCSVCGCAMEFVDMQWEVR